ncbi:uncharacterized protein SPPG_04753 [Spizellomyces punctatus DAOM BR117]|uniref:Band 7 domain-containing protein n=1 Tax=Spizellomyces punctatus (strain DAOM BR117) TaxID=645134 RepID=A0A0L0HHY7_SPIPD|nr:uncharacterized protein SPPG_04753 [Spizellomyces punctatus DAOM BR117]KND00434.1 hypothetical protein SPPG_04753 [Spizellomyces punctatus DAOM BR117]|eukprot:XP_016608473.1 hypothetical protein SPPG_04753 [Spizellomyces punctatus DAOM BR117]
MLAPRNMSYPLSRCVRVVPKRLEAICVSSSTTLQRRTYQYGPGGSFGSASNYWGGAGSGGGGFSSTKRSRNLPANTVVKFVPQQEAWIVERMGKFHRILEPGLAILVPVLDRIRYVKSLKEVAVEIPSQSAITHDNVTLELDGVLYYRVVDPYKASYGVEDAEFAVAQLAQTTMRAEIGQMTLDRTLAERTQLNFNIVNAINSAAADWGIKCLRYEIRDIHPPENVVVAMHQQVSAERRKRAEILESEGARQASINVAEGRKQSAILESEAVKARQINHAQGEAEAILLRAQANSQSIERIAQAIQSHGNTGQDAVSLSVAEKYIEAFGALAKEGTTVVVPSNVNDISGMVTQMMTVYNAVRDGRPGPRSAPAMPSISQHVPSAERVLQKTGAPTDGKTA